MVIPTYNDSKSLRLLIEMINQTPSDKLRFLLVDNGSTDLEVPRLLEKVGHNWATLRTSENLGFGGGILYGIHHADTEFVGWMPGNLKIDPRDLPSFIEKIEFNQNMVVKAQRVGRKTEARVKTYLLGVVQSTLLRVRMFDAGGTPTIINKRFVKTLESGPRDYVFESYVLFVATTMGMEIVRPPIYYGSRLFGSSHWQKGLRSEIKLFTKVLMESRSWKKMTN